MMIIAWKCYRCSLIFENEANADLHNDITKHYTQQIELIKV